MAVLKSKHGFHSAPEKGISDCILALPITHQLSQVFYVRGRLWKKIVSTVIMINSTYVCLDDKIQFLITDDEAGFWRSWNVCFELLSNTGLFSVSVFVAWTVPPFVTLQRAEMLSSPAVRSFSHCSQTEFGFPVLPPLSFHGVVERRLCFFPLECSSCIVPCWN